MLPQNKSLTSSGTEQNCGALQNSLEHDTELNKIIKIDTLLQLYITHFDSVQVSLKIIMVCSTIECKFDDIWLEF